MITRSLFYDDPLAREFSAQVVSCTQREKLWAVTLADTLFYPEGGGQAGDTGALGAVRVLDTREEDGCVVHLCDGPLPVGDVVTGAINFAQRLDRMQQHSGEHILSGLIFRKFGYHNVGFHLGEETTEMDFDGIIPQEALPELERLANEAVMADLPIRSFIPAPQELAGLEYRTKKALPWPVRIVEIPGYDSCACCGVHVPTTGRIGLIKILSCVKFHSGVRLELVCGYRAIAYMARVWEESRQAGRLLSAPVTEVAQAAQRLQQQLTQEKYRASNLEKQLFAAIAHRFAGKGDSLCVYEDLDAAQTRLLADAITQICGGCGCVLSGKNICLLGAQERVNALANRLRALGIRGGGKPGSFQGVWETEPTKLLLEEGFCQVS